MVKATDLGFSKIQIFGFGKFMKFVTNKNIGIQAWNILINFALILFKPFPW